MVEIIKSNTEQDIKLKDELKGLAAAINIKEKAESFWKIDDLLNKIDSLDGDQKNLALQHALKDSDIMIENTPTKLWTIAELFDKALEQDNQTWKLKLKEWAELKDNERALVEPFLNEKESPLAYLIQKSSNFAKIQAGRWYGSKSNELIEIWEDRILWNQTKRALSGLQSWIESDLEASEDTIEVSKLGVATILGMKYISQTLKEKIEDKWSNEVKKLWEDDAYEYSNPYTNNFALRKKWEKLKKEDASKEKGINNWTQTENQSPQTPEEGFEADINDKETTEILMEEIQNSWLGTLSYYGKQMPISCKFRNELVVSGSPTVGWGYTTTTPIYDSIILSTEGASIKIPLKEMLNKEGNFDRDYRSNTILPFQKEKLKNTLLAKKIAEEARGKAFTRTDIFKKEGDWNTIAVWKKAKISKYFKLFDDQKILIDKGISYTFGKDEKVFLHLNDKFWDESYNIPKNNSDLIIDAKELVNDQWKLDEEKLKKKLRVVIENIIENYEL